MRHLPRKIPATRLKMAICSMVKCGDASEMQVISNLGLPQASRGP